jgi:hypothetical protein
MALDRGVILDILQSKFPSIVSEQKTVWFLLFDIGVCQEKDDRSDRYTLHFHPNLVFVPTHISYKPANLSFSYNFCLFLIILGVRSPTVGAMYQSLW